ncbi:TfoX/Sxy family protein [Thalassovita aquimarina]|uniref:TfoX/Sxy family protein n=1 Tax=Thalassovita aquimarina TaxID=2785917 RepID=A0ABS5HSV2_9RHOB|nr:TfoX/Sxy family protein [Thalassovita aquimarina]MBR9651862.1 TfoX/Sxy family protein [Thalassovita aquimarina]
MAYDEGLAQLMRDDLAGESGISEKRMFGGLCFLLHGNMVCGVHKNGGMFRTGKEREAEALAIDGARPIDFTGRRMGGIVDVDEDLMADDARRARLMALALAHTRALPQK